MGLRNRWNYSGYPYFVTTTAVEWINVFKGKEYFDILCESLIFCKDKFRCRLLAYCLMNNHVHLVVWPDRKAAISDFMRDFKKYTSVQMLIWIGECAVRRKLLTAQKCTEMPLDHYAKEVL